MAEHTDPRRNQTIVAEHLEVLQGRWERALAENGFDPNTIPYVLQLNKRDLPTALPPEHLAEELKFRNEPVFEAVATTGDGVFETLKGIVKQVLVDLKSR